MGDGRLQPAEVELENINWARKSIVAAEDILPDDVITIQKLHIKRPGTGISPAELEKVIGKRARVKIKADTLINWKQLK